MTQAPDLDQGRNQPVVTVSEFTGGVRALLEEQYPMVWIRGEISNLRRPGSGHWYFTLKDANAQLRCAAFRGRNRALRFAPEDGLEVVVRGRVSLYAERGDFQIIVDSMRPAGDGALRLAMEQLRARLQEEGLLDPARRRPLPGLPLHIALVTSPTGAALQDMLAVLTNRYRLARVTVVPALVQGEEAPSSLCAALNRAAGLDAVDVVVVGRGGGSIEDLWAFNTESVARAIATMPVPTVSAVGHETDITIADLVADLRAPTPSAAMEAVAPDHRQLADAVHRLKTELRGRITQQLHTARTDLLDGRRRLHAQQPRSGLQTQQLRAIQTRLGAAMERVLHERRRHLVGTVLHHPRQLLEASGERLNDLRGRLVRSLHGRLRQQQVQLAATTRNLQAVSPLNVLERGYAIVTTVPDGDTRAAAVLAATEVRPGDPLDVRLARGRLRVRVENSPGAE